MTTSRNSTGPFDWDVARWPALPTARGLFVTGTDTEVGKTVVAGAIARHQRRAGRPVEVFKPAASGCAGGGGQLMSEDAAFLAACADSQRPLSEITPVRYAAALAPNVAAEREGRPVDVEAILSAYSRMAAAGRPIIVEGVGGLLCPISDDFWVVHLARLTGLPLVIVARAGLGTINHTLLTLHAARTAGLTVAGVVVNRYPADDLADGDLSTATNPRQIADRGQVRVLTLIPDDPRTSVADARIGEDTQFAIDGVNWEVLMGMTNRV